MFSTKAKNLNFLKDKLSKSIVGDQISFSLNDWNKNKKQKLKDLKIFFKKKKVIIRSSSKLEDRSNASLAGHFLSIQNVDVNNTSLLSLKIDKVWNSLKHKKNLLDKIFIQEYISDVILSGVIFTRGINNNSNYYFINFDEKNNSTNNITSGKINGKTVIINRVIKRKFIEIFFINILRSIQEIENILKFYNLDIEFAIDKEKQIHIFQYRKLNNINRFKFDLNVFNKNLNKNIRRFLNYKKLDKTNITNNFLSNMSDWNPAEMIGILPKDFAYDLYSKLITNKMWYLQRKEFGGSKLSDHKLMKKILGRPYVDIGLSLKSFIPNNLNKKLKNKLVVTYLEYLSKKKYLHDKIEFEVAFTSWTPDLPTLLKKRFGKNIFSKSEIENISASLKKITSSYILNNQKYLKQSNELLIKRNKIINDKNKSEIEKVIILINDCKRYGILPFAHAARMSFISKSILNYFLRKKFYLNKGTIIF